LKAVESLPGSVESILIVDDNLDVCRMFSQMLQTSPNRYRVLTAHSGKEGLAIMRQDVPDAVILDILMPDLDGFAVIQRMKQEPALADIRIVLASAYGASEAIASNTQGEISIHKSTGFKPSELINCIDAVVAELIASTGQ
jgi:CheY-like chemotaxis protein